MALVKRGEKGSPISGSEYDAVVEQVEINDAAIQVVQSTIQTSEVIFSVASEAAMTAKYNDEVTAGRTPIDGKEQVFRTDLNEFWKWNSSLTVKGEFSRTYLEVATEITENNPDLVPSSLLWTLKQAIDEALGDKFNTADLEGLSTSNPDDEDQTKLAQIIAVKAYANSKVKNTFDATNEVDAGSMKATFDKFNPLGDFTITNFEEKVYNASNLTGVASVNEYTSQLIPVEDIFIFSSTIFRSISENFSSGVIGFTDENESNPQMLLTGWDFAVPNSSVVTLTDYELTIPATINFVKLTNRKTNPFSYKRRFTTSEKVSFEILSKTANSSEILKTSEKLEVGKEIYNKVNKEIINADKILVDILKDTLFTDNEGLKVSDLTPHTNNDERVSDLISVEKFVLISTSLWKSSSPLFSSVIVGYEDVSSTNPTILVNANDFSNPTSSTVTLTDYKLTIPENIKFVRVPNRKTAPFKIEKLTNFEGVSSELIGKVIDSENASILSEISENKLDARGEMIINNSRLASLETHSQLHDSQILVDKIAGKLRILVFYRTIDKYVLSIISAVTYELIETIDVTSTVGWAPRMYKKDANTIRLVYTISKTDVFYRDFSLVDGTLGTQTTFKVAIKVDASTYDTAVALTLDRFLDHVENTTGIDYRDSAYDTFASRNVLVEDTQQIQKVGNIYYLTCQILADTMPNGDTGGIACLMSSTDLDTWKLLDPISISTDVNEQRDHEVSATYLNGKWHALTRYNIGGLNIGAPAGYMYYTSNDGNSWTDGVLLDLPDALNGIRHGIFKHKLRLAQPFGTSSNKTDKEVALFIYQKIPSIYGVKEFDNTTHKLRTELVLCYTTDFINFTKIANISDRDSLTYPSITVHQDTVYLSWSSGKLNGLFTSAIVWSKYNLSKIL